ncbi:hypothetical protein HF086_006353 [Spodoptera exigua]|uniref:Ferrochelatase n=1 Tax=Spodoptera exigua TaxID=7107 RepID=A0A922SL24_SPOEX|nr:hypothetical protein HF086_006353 [Spodoptera exigua]
MTPEISVFLFDHRDGVERAVIFSQYPQYSCATTGSIPKNIKFSLIERWATHPLLAKVFAERIKEKLDVFDPEVRDDVVILFTAHSLPLKAVSRGDTYPHEVAATVANTMLQLNVKNPYRLVWQSKAYAKQGRKNLLLVPIAFVNEHIETLHELDIEYCHDIAKEAGITRIERAATPNAHPTFISALADIVVQHLAGQEKVSKQFLTRCPHCVSERCHKSKEFFKELCAGDVTIDTNNIKSQESQLNVK